MRKAFLYIAIALLPYIGYGQIVNIGDILCTDGSTVSREAFLSSGQTAKGIVFYVDNTNRHGWALHLEYQGAKLWSSGNYDIPNLNNYRQFRDAINDFDGYENTRKIRAAGNASLYPAAWAVDFTNGWYLPAAGQIRYLYGYIPEINRSLETVGGEIINLTNDWWLWASTECNYEHAWDINSQGAEGHSRKDDHSFYVRSVINF